MDLVDNQSIHFLFLIYANKASNKVTSFLFIVLSNRNIFFIAFIYLNKSNAMKCQNILYTINFLSCFIYYCTIFRASYLFKIEDNNKLYCII